MAANTWQPENSFSSLSSDAGYGSGPAGGPGSSTPAGVAFKVMLKDIANQLSTDDLDKLAFFCGNNRGDSAKKSALDLLWGMVKRGKFSCKCVDGLERHLRHIDRCDLITDYLEPFVTRFPVREVTGVAVVGHESHGLHQESLSREGDAMSGSGIPATTLHSSHHGSPSLPSTWQHSHSQPSMKSHSSGPHSGSQTLHSGSVPAESAANASQSLVVGRNGKWVKGIIEAGHTSVESASETSASLSMDINHNNNQSHAPNFDKVQTSPMIGSEFASNSNSWQSTSYTSATAQTGKGGQPKILPARSTFQPRPFPLHTRPGSTDPSLSSLCRVQEDEVLGNMDIETASISSGLILNALPYATTTETNSNMHRQLSRSRTNSQDRNSVSSIHSGSHLLEESSLEQSMQFTPHSSSTGVSGMTDSSGVFSPAHSAVGSHGGDGHMEARATGSHAEARATGGIQVPGNKFSASLPVKREEQREISVLRLTHSSSLQASSIPKGGLTYTGDHVIILSSADVVKFIGDKVGGVHQEFSVKVNVNCRCGRQKEIKMKLIPHKEQHHQYVSLDACLHMPRRCSRHKWLVQFTHSHLQVNTVVTQNGREVCAASETTPILPMDDPGGENLTQLSVANVMSHEHLLYKKAAQYRLKVMVNLIVEGYIADCSAVQFHWVEQQLELEKNQEESEPFVEIKRKM